LPSFDRTSPPLKISSSEALSASCRCAEYLSKISDLESRLSLLKRQAKNDVEQAEKSFGLMKQVSSLESQMSDLMAKIVRLEECDSFLINVIKLACDQLQCELLEAPLRFFP
jgi:hypothetical protein